MKVTSFEELKGAIIATRPNAFEETKLIVHKSGAKASGEFKLAPRLYDESEIDEFHIASRPKESLAVSRHGPFSLRPASVATRETS